MAEENMAYIVEPRWAKWWQRGLLSLHYSVLVVAGLLSWLHYTAWGTSWAGMLLAVTTITCAVGAFLGRWEVEWIGLGPAMAALGSFLVVADTNPGRALWWSVVGLITGMASRWITLFRENRMARRRRLLLKTAVERGYFNGS